MWLPVLRSSKGPKVFPKSVPHAAVCQARVHGKLQWKALDSRRFGAFGYRLGEPL